MINYLIDVFVIAIIVMITIGGLVFVLEKLANKFPNLKNKLENLFSDEYNN